MTICIDLSAAAQERAGLGRYAANLAQALLEFEPGLTAFVNETRASALRPPLSRLPLRTAHLARKPWRLAAASSYFGGPALDAIFSGVALFHATAHLLPRLRHVRSVFTLHDVAYLLFPQYHLWQNRLYLRLMMPRFLAQADAVLAVSENTRRDALRFYHLPPEKVHVIPEGVEARFQPQALAEARQALKAKYRLPDRFILCVGTLEPRKNLPHLLEAFAALRPTHPAVGLVIAGGKGWLYASFFEKLRTLRLEPFVTLTGYVPEDDLPLLLSCAEVFAFPSVFEGFGLPPLEAMACGTPVVCSNASSLPEVVGEAGILLSPYAILAWAEALSGVLSNPALQAELRQRGLRRAAQFTWAQTAQKTRQIYAALLPAGKDARR